MAEVTNELIYGVLKNVQQDVSMIRSGQRDLAERLNSVERQVAGLRVDFARLREDTARSGSRMDRVGDRTDLTPAG